MNEKKPLVLIMEEARERLISEFNTIAADTKIPGYLLESVVLELLAEVRNRKFYELSSGFKEMLSESKKE